MGFLSRILYSDFSIPGTGKKGTGSRTQHWVDKEFFCSILIPKHVYELLETLSGMFFPDLDFFPFRISDPDPGFRGSKKYWILDPRSAILVEPVPGRLK
jgi:hypothetical protein